MSHLPSVVILSYPGALQSAVLGLSDILAFAGLSPRVVTRPEERPDQVSVIVLPPSERHPAPEDAPWIPEWLRHSAENGALICSACVGVTWIAAAGLDAGRPVTTHWAIGAEIRKVWPGLKVETDRLVIEYSDLVTAGGLMAWIDLALIVIERLSGHQQMLSTARHFVVDPGRRDQRRFKRFQPDMDHGDTKILTVQKIIETQIREQHRIADLAAQVALSPRTFQRKFTDATGVSVTDYMQRLRVEHAKTLLADTMKSVADIARDVGYSDVPAFHRVFVKTTGVPPSAFRLSVQDRSGRASADNMAGHSKGIERVAADATRAIT